ncbi:MAG TPA: GNAT family N-acetyltransferase [Clostridiales bacterium]|jgi:ribosomal protein S18 acetylase RimI-like enzyme|nr:GNAT family N-acetyltransferase [Clostridiales bacterium]
MLIRLMCAADYDRMYRLWSETEGLGFGELDDSREGIERFLARNPTSCFVAEEDGILLGTIMSGQDGLRGYIYHAVVQPGKRRQGIGRALVEAVVEAMKKEEIDQLALVVYKNNLPGNRFWESMGFVARDDLSFRCLSWGLRNSR